MKPAPFDYMACLDTAEALSCLAEYGDDARILAGGQSLIAMLNMRLAEPKLVADISRIGELAGISADGGALRVGASVTQATLMNWPQLADHALLLAQVLPHVGHFQTRNKGTVCGSLAHADPSSELPLVASVLGATMELSRAGGTRDVPARHFFTGLLRTDRNPDEMVTSVSFPCRKDGEHFAFREMAMRHGDFAIVAIAAKITPGTITIGVGGGPEKPEVREWPMMSGTALDDALNTLAWDIPFQDDVHAGAAYRRRLVRALGRQTIEEACACRV